MPAAGALDVDPSTMIQATLSEALDLATVSNATVRLRVSGSSTDVPAVVSLNGPIISLDPSAPLAGNTLYEATLTTGVEDLAGNALAADVQWTFTTAPTQWVQTTAADFVAGSHQSRVATETAGGAIQLAPEFSDGFAGTALSGQWNVQSWEGAGGGPASTVVSNGTLRMGGEQILSTGTFADRAVVIRAAFGSIPYQHLGLATDFSAFAGQYWAAFSSGGTSDTLFARVNVSGTEQVINLGPLPSGLHDYRIVPTGTAFEFYVDGVLRTTVSASFPAATPVRVAMSSFLSGVIEIDLVQIESFASTGEFTSSIFDAGAQVTWGTANWTADVPAGTTLVVETRSGDTATPDGTWSAWAAASNGSTVASPAGRFLQYRVRFTTSTPNTTPQLFDITFGWE